MNTDLSTCRKTLCARRKFISLYIWNNKGTPLQDAQKGAPRRAVPQAMPQQVKR